VTGGVTAPSAIQPPRVVPWCAFQVNIGPHRANTGLPVARPLATDYPPRVRSPNGRWPLPYALVVQGPDDVAAVLMVLDDCAEAEDIAFEMRQAGHGVEVRQVGEGRMEQWTARPDEAASHI